MFLIRWYGVNKFSRSVKNKVDKKYLYKVNNSPLAIVSPNLAQPQVSCVKSMRGILTADKRR
jgi:hypothetical protein